jgi:uroporphyrinogen-III decarboxylase
LQLDNARLTQSVVYDTDNPCWKEKYIVKNSAELAAYIGATLSEDVSFDFVKAEKAHRECGDDILVEYFLGDAVFDFIAEAMGFENAIVFFMDDNDTLLEAYREKYTAHKIALLREAAENTGFESFFIGCNFSCNSLLGPELWRKWDKPYLKAVTAEAHRLGKLVHCHNHGKVMATVPDLAEIGFDCVCPFERLPGDINGLADLRTVRRALDDKVTFNGNVSTITALINGSPDDVRREVQEIKEAFAGTPRLIIGTGDQVGGETPEENILAMIEEGRKP